MPGKLPQNKVGINQILFEDGNVMEVYHFSSTQERKATLDKLYDEAIGITDMKLICKIKALLNEYEEIIATNTDDLSRSKLLPHAITLKENSAPVKQRTYRLSKAKADILKEELTKLINKKLIVPSHSAWSSPVILIPKKNGKWRLCIDYRRLNEMTIKDAYALPFIEEILYSIGGEIEAISTIDLFSGYHQIPMKEEDIEKTGFTTMFGNYNFVVMPFGLTNAPATFQREMNRIFFPLIGKCMFVYLDDLVIFSKSREQHMKDLGSVFRIIQENGLKVNLEKCHFFMTEVEVLGHLLTTEGIKPTAAKIEAIKQWKQPATLTELRSFLGTVSYYRKFIPNFAQIANSMYKLLRKDTEFIWSNQCQVGFDQLKQAIMNYPILKFPDFSKPFIIRTDASYEGLGGVLLQKYDNKEFPVHFVSRSIKKEERNYPITKLEGAAAYFSVMKFKSYITGNNFDTTLYTDHKPLVGLFKNKEPTERQLSNWILEFSMLKVNVVYEEGRTNFLADALSRMSHNKNNLNEEKEGKKNLTTVASITQFMDDYLEPKFVKIKNEEYYKEGENLRKVVLDNHQKWKLLKQAHEVGHEGFLKTYNRLKRDYYWPNMTRDVNLIVKTCHKCQLFRPRPFPKDVENITTPVEAPFVRVGLDLVGPLPKTKRNNLYLVVLVDYFTGWVEAEPLHKIESTDIISFLTRVFSRHGIPELLITDNGPQFVSAQTKGFLDLYNVYISPSTTNHPATNGKVENRNKEISKYLRLLSKAEKDWDELLPTALWALRTTKNETTGFSSFELLYGRRDKQPFELLVNIDKRLPNET